MVTSGASQTGAGNSRFSTPLRITVIDASGHFVSSVPVTFSAPGNGPSGTFVGGRRVAVVLTDSNGVATAPGLSAGTTPGTYHVTASISGLAGPISFTLTNLPLLKPAPTPARAIGAVVFLTQPGKTLPGGVMPPFQVLALDQFGNPLNGVVVTLNFVPVRAHGVPSSTVVGTVQAVAVNGVATFTQPSMGIRGRYRLRADVGSSPVFSEPFTVGLFGRLS
jgi:hypothetical protein